MQVLGVCFFLVMLLALLIVFFISIFRQACAFSGLPKPSMATAFGVMLLIRISTTLCEAIMDLLVRESCDLAGLPHWESHIIVFFLLFPIDLLISAGLHAGLMNIKFGKGIEVWFAQWLMILSIVAVIAFVLGSVELANELNG